MTIASRPADPSPEGSKHLAFIDGLRAMAVLAVVLSHTWVYADAWHYSSAAPLLALAHHGVDLFFVVSGFCLAYPTLLRVRNGAKFSFDVLDFAAKRLVRIFPPYLVALALFCVLLPTPTWEPAAITGGASTYTLAGTIREYLLLDRYPLHDPSFWTLGIELRWYMVFPIAILLFVRAPKALWFAVVACYALYFGSKFNSHDVFTLPTFLSGMVAAWIMIARARVAKYLWLAVAAALLPALEPLAWARDISWTLLVFCLVVLASTNPALKEMLSWKPLAFIGVASYSIYLVHEPVIAWASRWAPPAVIPMVGLACGIGFWALVERPLLAPIRRRAMVTTVRNVLNTVWSQLRSRSLDSHEAGYVDTLRPPAERPKLRIIEGQIEQREPSRMPAQSALT